MPSARGPLRRSEAAAETHRRGPVTAGMGSAGLVRRRAGTGQPGRRYLLPATGRTAGPGQPAGALSSQPSVSPCWSPGLGRPGGPDVPKAEAVTGPRRIQITRGGAVPVGSPCCRGPDAMDLKRTALIATSVDVAANT